MKVYLTRKIPDSGMNLLKEKCEMEVYPNDFPPTKEEIIEGVKDKDGLLCLLTDPIDKEVINAGNLKIIANYAVGYDNIDVREATKRGIPVSNTPGVLTETVADLTWTLLTAIARKIVEGDKMMRRGDFKGWSPLLLLGSDIHKKTLGIVGAGRIGKAVARRAIGFEMEILYNDVDRDKKFEKDCGAKYLSLKELLKKADFVSLHVPVTKETRYLIGKEELEMMKDTAYLINTSRGKCIDESALVNALKRKIIAGAALDVFENEPKIAPRLEKLENVVIVPHIGSASIETREKMAVMAAENMIAGLEGKVPPNCVNPEVFDS